MNHFNSLSRYSPHLLALLRVFAGLLFLAHGLAKLFGFPAGAQPGQVPLFGLMGAGAIIELVTGMLIVLGLFTRPAAFIAAGQMAIAYWMFHAPSGFYPILNGGELAILYCSSSSISPLPAPARSVWTGNGRLPRRRRERGETMTRNIAVIVGSLRAARSAA